MPRVTPENRQRAYRPKTSTGCITCRSEETGLHGDLQCYSPSRIERRVKCGEERPACIRCTATGRICDGYGVPATPVSSGESTSQSNVFKRALIARPLNTPSYDIFTSEERRSFEFFLLNTAPQLAGDFECAFWERLLLQTVHHESAIRHVTVALGSLHEHFQRDAGAPFSSRVLATDNTFALRQYLRAIRCLMPSPGASQSIDSLRGHYGSAITHITSGLKILGELRNKNWSRSAAFNLGRTPYVSVDILCGLFTRLQAQASVTVNGIPAAGFDLWPDLVIDFSKPVVFHSLADAREMLEIYTYYYRQHITQLRNLSTQARSNHVTPASTVLRDTSLSLLAQWTAGLDEFLHKHGASFTARERRGAAVLQLRKLECFVMLDSLRPEDELDPSEKIWLDRYCSSFEQMVALGDSIVELSSSLPSSSPKSFSLDLGIISAMFNVASQCRDPHIRRRAIRVLRTAAVQEGVWNSHFVAKIAEKWIEIEEEGLGAVTSCGDVPASARLLHFLPVFDVDQPSALVYFSHSSTLDSMTVRREVIQW
ncbi:uncharacterized protein N7503_001751 [Penicillium pulvis]|uniref:uncharacterized protein n=1 Tax=Penicillium pulvis TaxID=1562058 RepID=UPI002546D0E5|nr:uncharacterized protein N7503_001751 [Penicillium pulvis]KAJ5809533.1 hypothetical protein N7503_001751 [Penicillium pulvis]